MPLASVPNRRLPGLALAVPLVLALSVAAPPAGAQAQPQTPAQPQTQAQPEAPPSFADLARSQIDTVVNIATRQAAPRAGAPLPPELPEFPPGSPFEEFFREFRERGGERPEPGPVSALGSGFIVDPGGYVVTNSHVVADAEEISVVLHDGRRLEAEVVGVDQPTDIALLKVKADQPLPNTRWGDSDRVQVGDWVMAIGNPFGLGGTVTTGILSARARDIQQGPYDEYLQTDASINRGNSGGPLFNMAGEVIGINTAIYSPTGGSVGIGFAIPSTLARPVVEALRRHGEVRRGWLGVQVQGVTPEIAESLGLAEQRGALVTTVTPGGPAEAAGIRQGDVIVSFAGTPIEEMRELPRIVARTDIGSTVPVELLRGDERTSVAVTVGRLDPQLLAGTGASGQAPPAEPQGTETALGLTLAPLTPGLRERFEIPPRTEGVVVTGVEDDSEASRRGIDAGDVIVEAGQEPVREPGDVAEQVRKAKQADRKSVLMLIERRGDLRYVPVPLDGAG